MNLFKETLFKLFEMVKRIKNIKLERDIQIKT